MAEITLTKGFCAIVDDVDFESLAAFAWHATIGGRAGLTNEKPYARRSIWEDGRSRSILMHREIMGSPDGVLIDHINRNTLDNRRANLRLANHADNARNAGAKGPSKCGRRGVLIERARGRGERYVATVKVDGRSIYSRQSDSIELAARYYDALASHHHGPFATLNFPGEELLALADALPISPGRALARPHPIGAAGFRGVHQPVASSRYLAMICKDGVRYNLGRHENAVEAARAYDAAALQHFGEAAVLNFPAEAAR